MSRSSYWFDLARKAAAERQETYGEEPGSSVARLLAAGSTPGLWGTLRLAVFVLAGAPRY